MVIKRIHPVSCARITGTLYAILGLCVGAVFSLVALAGGMRSNSAGGAGMGALIGAGAIIAFPIFYGVLGSIISLVGAWLYNVLAGMVGGLELDVE